MIQSRRSFLTQFASAVSAAAFSSGSDESAWSAESKTRSSEMLLGFSTYGTKTLTTEESINLIQKTGYDSVEITVWPDWDASPDRMTKDRRRSIRRHLSDSGLVLTSLMEHLYPEQNDARHQKSLDRLKSVFELANDLAPDHPPLVQTVLGGGTWSEKKTLFVDRTGSWSALGQSFNVVTCIKPHRGGAMSRPSEASWLIEQTGQERWLKMVYDYSHYAFRGIPLKESIEQALPHIGHVAVKDAVQIPSTAGKSPRVEFQLPGEAGTIDFVTILKTLAEGGYTGDISCEVSGMVSGKDGYDPEAAVRTCYRNMSRAFVRAGVSRS